jgi:O-antigen/teichoic acid export membrane protein
MPQSPLARLRALPERFLRNPLLQRVIRNSGYLFSAKTGSAALSFGQSVLAGRLLGVAGLGTLGAITQFSGLINRLTSFRMGDLVVSYVGEFSSQDKPHHAAAVFKAAGLVEITTSAIAYGLVVALSSMAARLLAPDQNLAGLFAFYGLTVLVNLMAESANGLLQIYDRYRLIAAITLGQSVATLVLITAAYLAHGGLLMVVGAYLAGKALWAISISAAAIWQARRAWGGGWWRAPLSLLASRRREMVRFAVSTNVTGTLTLITRDSEMLWLNALSTPVQAGYYKLALAFTNVVLIPVDPLISTTFREVAREVGGKRWENVRYLLRSGSLISAAFTIPAALGLAVLGPWVISLTYGPAFLPAYVPLLVLLAGVLVINIFYWNRNTLLPMGLPEYPTKVYLVGAILRVLGILTLVPSLGAVGMAALLSAFFIGTTLVLVWRIVLELRRTERSPSMAAGG